MELFLTLCLVVMEVAPDIQMGLLPRTWETDCVQEQMLALTGRTLEFLDSILKKFFFSNFHTALDILVWLLFPLGMTFLSIVYPYATPFSL